MNADEVRWVLARDEERIPLRAKRCGSRGGLPHFKLYTDGAGMVPVGAYGLEPAESGQAQCSVELATRRVGRRRSRMRRDYGTGRKMGHAGEPPGGPEIELVVLPWPEEGGEDGA